MGSPYDPRDPNQQWAPPPAVEPSAGEGLGEDVDQTTTIGRGAGYSSADDAAPAGQSESQRHQPPQGQPFPPQQPQYQQPQHEYQQQSFNQPQGQQPYGQQPQFGPPLGQQPQFGPPLGQQPYGDPYRAQQHQQAQAQNQWAAAPQFSPAEQGDGGKQSPSKTLWISLGAGAVVAVVAAISLWVIPTFFTTTVLDQESIQNGVMGVLVDAQVDASTVACPSGVEVKVGATFTCDVNINGVVKKVESQITSAKGNYDVTLPSGS